MNFIRDISDPTTQGKKILKFKFQQLKKTCRYVCGQKPTHDSVTQIQEDVNWVGLSLDLAGN